MREHGLAAELTRIGVPYSTATLDVGDILFQTEDRVLLVIERKSHADFAASNQDGRYREQRARLMAVRGGGTAVLYILEGSWTNDRVGGGGGWAGKGGGERTYGRTSETQLKRLTTRLLLRYGMPVLTTASLTETAAWCRVLLAQLTDDPTVFDPEDDMAAATMAAMTSMTAALTLTKKGNKTATGTATAMLSAIPGLGAKRVEALLAEKSVADLVSLSTAELAALVVGGKRLGDKMGATVYEALRARA